MSVAGEYVRVRIIGESGIGKTDLAYAFAAKFGRPFLKVNAGAMQSPDAWFGMRRINADGDYYQESAFVRALHTPRTVIFLEEFNRVHPSVHAPLFALFDDTREAWIDEIQRHVEVDPSVVILAAMNVGAQYTGTFDMDAAMESRFQYPLELTHMEPVQEAKVLVKKTGIEPKVAASLVELATEIRRRADPSLPNPLDRTISTRTLLATAKLITKGKIGVAAAVRGTIIPLYSTEGGAGSQRSDVGKIVQGKFGA